MAVWHDPLDDLIADLDAAVPAAPLAMRLDLPSLEDLQWVVTEILWGSPEDLAKAQADPRFQKVFDDLAASMARSGDPG